MRVMSVEQIVSKIRLELKKRGSRVNVEKKRRFHKEAITSYGLTVPQTQEVVDRLFPLVEGNLKLALKVGEALLKSNVIEEGSVAIRILRKMTQRFTPELFETFDRWVNYCTNWAITDTLSYRLIGEVLMLDASKIEQLLEWTKSKNRWRRRAAAVSLVKPALKGKFLNEVFLVAEPLMTDNDVIVQKGVGWLLKDASWKHPKEVRDFLMKRKEKTSALVLRYASERLPENMKALKSR